MRVDSASFFDDMAFVAAALVSADPCLCSFSYLSTVVWRCWTPSRGWNLAEEIVVLFLAKC